MNFWLHLLSSIALAVIFMTCVARVNDIKAGLTSWRWNLRRSGFVLSGCAALGIILYPLYSTSVPSWWEVAFRWGIASVWFTTPNMPPWWKYITNGMDKPTHPQRRAADKVL